MTPIPDHLRPYDWYAPHLAWLHSRGLPARHDPGDAAPKRANLQGANLRDANLQGADLQDANLQGADLQDAYLRDANLQDAYLRDANLQDAYLQDAAMPDGRTWEDYRSDHMAGICYTEDVRERAIAAWGNHTWDDCPMHAALGIDGLDKIEDTQRRLIVACWVALYDADLLPEPARKAGA